MTTSSISIREKCVKSACAQSSHPCRDQADVEAALTGGHGRIGQHGDELVADFRRNLECRASICERSPVKDSFQQALGETLSILTRSRMVSDLIQPFRASLEPETASIPDARPPEGAADGAGRDLTHERVFAALREAALVCVGCPHLARSRTQVVFGVGNQTPNSCLSARRLAPMRTLKASHSSGVQGSFSPKSSRRWAFGARMFTFQRSEMPSDMPPGSSGNRKPTPEEMKTCLPWLESKSSSSNRV